MDIYEIDKSENKAEEIHAQDAVTEIEKGDELQGENTSFTEEIIDISTLTEPGDGNFSLGMLNVYGKKVCYIYPNFFNRKLMPETDIRKEDSRIVDSCKVRFLPEDIKLRTNKKVYLVKYVPEGTMYNEITGEEQPTVNYEYPVTILREFSRKETASVLIGQDRIIHRVTKEEYTLENQLQAMGDSLAELSDERKISVQLELAKEAGNSGFVLTSKLPEVLSKADIDNYRTYAPSIELFVKKYLYPLFSYVKTETINGKTYPGLILFLNGKNKDDVLNSIKTAGVPGKSEEKSRNAHPAKKADMTPYMVKNVRKVLAEAADENGMILGSSIPKLLEQEPLKITDYKKYAVNLEEFIGKLADERFTYKKTYPVGEKTYPGVVLFRPGKTKVQSLSVQALLQTLNETDTDGVRIGVINVSSKSTGFINREYVNKNVYPDYSLSNEDSVIFQAEKLNIYPEGTSFNTKLYIYLVAFRTDGTIYNTKTHAEQPAIDYSYPVRILETFSRNDCVRISVEGSQVEISKYADADTESEQIISWLKDRLCSEISGKKYVLSSLFPEIAQKAGINDYKNYAASVEDFIHKYYPDLDLKKNVIIDGEKKSGVIFMKNDPPVMEDYIDPVTQLEILYEEEQYYECLTSDFLKKVNFCDLPENCMEIILSCAAKLMFPEKNQEITLSPYQLEVILNQSSLGFIKKWKNDAGFSPEIIENCAQSSIVSLDSRKHAGYICEMLNAIGRANSKNAKNDNYPGLIKRFSVSYDSILPYLFFVRTCNTSSLTNIENCVFEYVQVIKNLRAESFYNLVADEDRLLYFTAYLRAVDKYVIRVSEMSRMLHTSILSLYADSGNMDLSREICAIIAPDPSEPINQLVNFYFSFEVCTEETITKLYDSGFSRQLIQRVVALIWEKYSSEQILPDQFLKILAWIGLNDIFGSMDEILRISPVNNKFKKLNKGIQLINSFDRICELAKNDICMHILACYIRFIVCEDINSADQEDACRKIKDDWISYSAVGQEAVKELCSNPDKCADDGFLRMFSVYALDIENFSVLQDYYADWYANTQRKKSDSFPDLKNSLEALYTNKAYKAYCREFQEAQNQAIDYITDGDLITEYIDSLCCLQKYGEAVSFLRENSVLSGENKRKQIIRVLSENFKNNGLSNRAFSVFDDSFTEKQAVELLLEGCRSQEIIPAANSLTAIYCHQKEYLRAAYLYQIFKNKAEIGYSRLYAGIRKIIGFFNGKLNNHYDAVEYAFFTLCRDDLIDFLNWTGNISIPAWKGYQPGHPFSGVYDHFSADVTDVKSWERFRDHLKKRIDINAWQIVVCENMLAKLSGGICENSGKLISDMMNKTELTEFPANFIPYVQEYIMENDNHALCRDFVDFMKKEANADFFRKENEWNFRFAGVEERFKIYCIGQYSSTGDKLYYEAVSIFGIRLDYKEVAALSGTSGDKSFLYRIICRMYLAGENKAEISVLLHSGNWNNMTTGDLAVLNILKMIYSEEDSLLEKQLLKDDDAIYRFKHDCAKILSVYPEKQEMFFFDRNCADISYKLLVFAYLFPCLFDTDLYNKYVLTFDELNCDQELFEASLKFLASVYRAQLDYNQEYPFFYKRWRYLKLFLANALTDGANCRDDDIIDLMEKHGHFAVIYAESYKGFTENVRAFLKPGTISDSDKRYILYTLMTGQVGAFLENRGNEITGYSERERQLIKEMVSQLDYREVNLGIYSLYRNEILNGDFDDAISAAKGFSDYAADCLSALKDCGNDQEAMALFCKCAYEKKAAHAAKSVFRLEKEVFERYRTMLIPLMCSRQFLFYMYGSCRSAIVRFSKYSFEQQYISLTDYISKYNPAEAKAVQGYLLALKACVEKDREKAAGILDKADIFSDIPVQWKHEAELIRKYANGEIDVFQADSSISDSSEETGKKEIRFKFIEKLQETFRIEKERINFKTAGELYEKFIDPAADYTDRICSAVKLIVNYPNMSREKQTELQLPSKNSLILMTGLNSVLPEANLSPDAQARTLFDLYSGRKVFRGETERLKELNSLLIRRLKQPLALKTWTRFSGVIQEILEDNRMIFDFAELRERILSECEKLLKDSVSYETRYKGLNAILSLSSGLESVYSGIVFDAIRKECRKLENDARLSVSIVNADNMTDGKIYFMIRNVGQSAVSFSGGDYFVVLKQEGHPEVCIAIDSISELQGGSVTGGSAEIIMDDAGKHTDDSENGSGKKIKVSLAVMKKSVSDKSVIVCDTSENVFVKKKDENLIIRRKNHYDVDMAVTDSDMLFGREKLQDDLTDMIGDGVTVIYGPSRIGKTSLLNWVKYTYAKNEENVMTVSFGGEGGMGKESDYVEDFTNSRLHQPVPYDDDEKMSEYLLVQTIVQSLTAMRRRFRKPSKKAVPPEILQQMVEILTNDTLSISDRYDELNELLVSEDFRLWILLDEFQQVVENWKTIKASCEFVRVCQMLLAEKERGNIKIVVCGSDDLLRHMVLEDESVWRKAFPEGHRLAVEPLLKEPFSEMIRNEKKLSDTDVIYSDSALEALYSYTGGVALYGKEICNAVLSEISSQPQKYSGRHTIFVSDIADATQKLLNRQSSEMDTDAKGGIREIYSAVTKNLKPETDMQYLWYIAKWLNEHHDQNSFPKNVFNSDGILLDDKTLRDSLEIDVARGILESSENRSGEILYKFRTIFYYFAFLGNAKKLERARIFKEETASDSFETDSTGVNPLTMIEQFGTLSEQDKMTVFSSIYHQGLNETARENFKKDLGDYNTMGGVTVGGDIVSGGNKIGVQNNVQINIQNMSLALTEIMSGQNPAEAYKKLPTLSTYLATGLSEDKKSALQQKYLELQNPEISEEKQLEIQNEICEISSPALDAMANDYVAAEVNAVMSGENPELWETSDSDSSDMLLNMTKEDIDDLRQKLPESVQMQFDFAVMLHRTFSRLADEDNIDYCPVAILYCKMIEGLLKEKHLEVYIRKLAGSVSGDVVIGSRHVDWDYFLKRDGNIDQEKVNRNRKKLTIGTFSYPLGKIDDTNDIRSHITLYDEVIEALATPVGSDMPNQKDRKLWRKHALLLPWIREYRNRSAHELTPITKEDMENLSRILFDEQELERVVELARRG